MVGATLFRWSRKIFGILDFYLRRYVDIFHLWKQTQAQSRRIEMHQTSISSSTADRRLI